MNDRTSLDDQTLAPLPDRPTGPEVPAVPGYDLLGELGRGGMGVVYKARQRALNRTVALKMILAGGHAGAHAADRVRLEAQAVAQLKHPHVVQIYEVGEAAGCPCFSLEFMEGGSLADRLDGTPLPPADAARLVEALARAMHAAHPRGIVHRDLKPAVAELPHPGGLDAAHSVPTARCWRPAAPTARPGCGTAPRASRWARRWRLLRWLAVTRPCGGPTTIWRAGPSILRRQRAAVGREQGR